MSRQSREAHATSDNPSLRLVAGHAGAPDTTTRAADGRGTWLASIEQFWDDALRALKDHLEAEGDSRDHRPEVEPPAAPLLADD